MEDDSAIRRLDETGRLLIPKRMRRVLQWQGGDPIVLTMSGRDTLLLHRYPQMQALRAVATGYADVFFTTYQVPVALCDREHLLAHRGFALSGQPRISQAIRQLLEADVLSAASVPLLEGSPLQADVFVPIQPHVHAVGAVLLGKAELFRREALTNAAQLLARMIAAQLL